MLSAYWLLRLFWAIPTLFGVALIVFVLLRVALAIPDFLWGLTFILVLGEIVEIGACERVFGDPRHAYTKELLQAFPLPDVDPNWVNAVQ